LQYKVPTMAEEPPFTDAGLLVSYGPNVPAAARIVAATVDRILSGATPGDLPIEQPRRFELVGKTAQALGINIPQSLLLRADAVIQ
jgi:putative ABC transport system substrate-binding protein